MNDFINDNFLLQSDTARRLYHVHAASLPVIDYHCHLDPRDLADDRQFENIAQLWVLSDPYKHRAMRIAGVPEQFITGSASPREKFDCWTATVPQTLGNPLFHWTALELRRYFGIPDLLTPATAAHIWDTCNSLLRSPGYSARQLLARCNVECVCTSDRLLDDLQPHAKLAKSDCKTRVLPSLRADDVLAIELPDYAKWVRDLEHATGTPINSLDAFLAAINQRLDLFDRLGCRLTDHALDDFAYISTGDLETASLFTRHLAGESLSPSDKISLKSGLLRLLGLEYGRRGWILQLHIGAQRRTSSRLRTLAGPAGGYASIGKTCDIPSLCTFLDDLEKQNRLPRTILYTLNPADNAALAVLTGSYAEDHVCGKIQFGPAWWYNDHHFGMREQLENLASYGLLAGFIGMTTDSRSLLSMCRHEYFRRILCSEIAQRVDSGEYPSDDKLLGHLIQNISYRTPRQWVLGQ